MSASKPLGAHGLAASIHDLKLRDGRTVTELIGGRITSPPELVRTIEGATNLVIQIVDPELRWLERSLAGEKWDCELDGLWFRYIGTTKSGAAMTLTFEDLVVARLRELKGPKRVYAHRGQENEVTLAEFIISLVEEAKPSIPWVCPELEEQQPIETKKQADTATKESESKRGKGIGDAKGLKVKGDAPSAQQAELLEMAIQIASSLGAPSRVQTAVVAALIDETDAGAVDGNNVLEGLGPGGAEIADAATEIKNFLTGQGGYGEGGAIGYFESHPQAAPYEIAQAIQRSEFADGSNYAAFDDEAREWVEEFSGGVIESEGGSSSKTITKAKNFYVKGEGKRQKKKPETYWDAIQRYAKEVNWRAFADLGTFYYFDEEELSRGKVRLAIERHPGQRRPLNEQVEDVDFKFQENAPINEVTITALAQKWGVAPGGVVTVAGYGPASLGPGDPTPKEPAKIGLASAVKASTHEGKGRYLAVKVAVLLVGDPGVRKATVTARKPSRPLPESAVETETLSGEAITDGEGAPTGTGSKNTLQLAKEAFTVTGTVDWNGVTIAKWIYPALLWAEENGGNTEVTSGYRPGVDSHTATGASEHQGDCYASPGEKGAIDFGGFVDQTGKEHRESFLSSLAKGYPGPMLIKATGFEDDGHCSATGS